MLCGGVFVGSADVDMSELCDEIGNSNAGGSAFFFDVESFQTKLSDGEIDWSFDVGDEFWISGEETVDV